MMFQLKKKEESRITLPDAIFSGKLVKTINAGIWTSESESLFTRAAQQLENARIGLFSLKFLGTEHIDDFLKAREVLDSLGVKDGHAGKHILSLQKEVNETLRKKSPSAKKLPLLVAYHNKIRDISLANGSKFNIQTSDFPYTRN